MPRSRRHCMRRTGKGAGCPHGKTMLVCERWRKQQYCAKVAYTHFFQINVYRMFSYIFFRCVSFVHVSETVAIRVRSGRLHSGSGRIPRNGGLLDKPRLPILPGCFGSPTNDTTRCGLYTRGTVQGKWVNGSNINQYNVNSCKFGVPAMQWFLLEVALLLAYFSVSKADGCRFWQSHRSASRGCREHVVWHC